MKFLLKVFTSILALSLPWLINAQSNNTQPDFEPIYYDHYRDTVDVDIKWYPRLDSIGTYMIEHPDCDLYVYAHGLTSEDGVHKIYGHCVASILNYLLKRYDIPYDRLKLVLSTSWQNGMLELKVVDNN